MCVSMCVCMLMCMCVCARAKTALYLQTPNCQPTYPQQQSMKQPRKGKGCQGLAIPADCVWQPRQRLALGSHSSFVFDRGVEPRGIGHLLRLIATPLGWRMMVCCRVWRSTACTRGTSSSEAFPGNHCMQGRVCGSSKDGRSFVFDRGVGPRGVGHLLRYTILVLLDRLGGG